MSLHFFVDFIKHLVEHGHIKIGHKKQATLNIWRAEHDKKVDGVLNIPRTKMTEELGIPVRKVTDKILGESNTGENVLRL